MFSQMLGNWNHNKTEAHAYQSYYFLWLGLMKITHTHICEIVLEHIYTSIEIVYIFMMSNFFSFIYLHFANSKQVWLIQKTLKIVFDAKSL